MNISRRNLVLRGLVGISSGILCEISDTATGAQTVKGKENDKFFKLHPVGEVKRHRKSTNLQISARYQDALKGLDGLFTHPCVVLV